MTNSAMLRLVMKKVTGFKPVNKNSDFNFTKDNQISFRLSDKDFINLTLKTEAEGFPSRPAYIKSLLYSVLDRKPIINDKEIFALDRSSRELMAIGRNLNQIAHALNIDFRQSDKVTLEVIETLKNKIDQHTDEVSKLIDRSVNRGGRLKE